jgi:hypothetical protein
VLSVPIDRITVIHGDTATVQEGIGTFGSRGIPVGGAAVPKAAGKVRAKAIRIATHLLEADESDIELADGRFFVRGATDQGVDLAAVAMTAFKPQRLPEGFDLGVGETAFHEPANLSYPSVCVLGHRLGLDDMPLGCRFFVEQSLEAAYLAGDDQRLAGEQARELFAGQLALDQPPGILVDGEARDKNAGRVVLEAERDPQVAAGRRPASHVTRR